MMDNTTKQLADALLAGFCKSWVCNAAITDDIEALRRICLEHSDWWNNTAWPALEAAGVTENMLCNEVKQDVRNKNKAS